MIVDFNFVLWEETHLVFGGACDGYALYKVSSGSSQFSSE